MKKETTYNWKMVFFLTLLPLVGIFGTSIYVYFNGVVWQEPILLLIFWFVSGMGITMGYHRLFSHKSYDTNIFLEWVLMICGSLAFENTILKWSSDHRKHHAQAETEEDPYSITEGFWHAHIGWILKNTPVEKNRVVGVKDLEKKSAIKFQNKYYFHIGVIFGLFLPLFIGYLYGRPLGAILWGSFLRITLVHHATFFINSLCHYVGKRTYDYNSTARDSWFVSFFTFGEGYHNYHHKFPADFRNGVKWFSFDPSKWIIKILSLVGITKRLKRTKDYIIWRSEIDSIRECLISKFDLLNKDYLEYYKNKIDSLYKNADDVLLKWKEIDMSFVKLSAQDKTFIRNMRRDISSCKLKLKHIKRDLNNVLSDIKLKQLATS